MGRLDRAGPRRRQTRGANKVSDAITDGVGAVTSMLPELMTVDADAEFAAAPARARATMPGAAARVWDVIDEVAANTVVGIRIAVRLGPVAVKSVEEPRRARYANSSGTAACNGSRIWIPRRTRARRERC